MSINQYAEFSLEFLIEHVHNFFPTVFAQFKARVPSFDATNGETMATKQLDNPNKILKVAERS